jgi:hypothetical protein
MKEVIGIKNHNLKHLVGDFQSHLKALKKTLVLMTYMIITGP